jgi:hypothetical protein
VEREAPVSSIDRELTAAVAASRGGVSSQPAIAK